MYSHTLCTLCTFYLIPKVIMLLKLFRHSLPGIKRTKLIIQEDIVAACEHVDTKLLSFLLFFFSLQSVWFSLGYFCRLLFKCVLCPTGGLDDWICSLSSAVEAFVCFSFSVPSSFQLSLSPRTSYVISISLFNGAANPQHLADIQCKSEAAISIGGRNNHRISIS